MTSVIEIEGLRKEYKRLRGSPHAAVDGLHLDVPAGGVYGFLGPNGSGKTTTIRCLLGLARPTAGTCRLLGAATPARVRDVIRRVGSIVETPALFPTMSGRRNLRLLGRTEGIGHRSVDSALDRVGLGERADDLVRTYSLGMRQRLGLAQALLKDPELLILDEPANGLDPAGIKEIRELLRSLGDEGRTVFVSSHLLVEIEHTCDQVAILSRGRCVVAGPVAEVLRQGHSSTLLVGLADLDAGLAALRQSGISASRNHSLLHVDLPPSEAARVTETLARSNLWITEMRADQVTLEDVFLELTADGTNEPATAGRPR
ncbi:MAG: ABC transporter ATP-binding protein [Actinomycetota bacterium]